MTNDTRENESVKEESPLLKRILGRARTASGRFFSNFILLLRETLSKFTLDRAWQKSAAMAFFVILSLAPMLLIIVKVVDGLYDPELARLEITYELEGVVGSESAEYINDLIDDAEESSQNSLPTLLFIFTIFLGSTSFFSNLKHAMNLAWGADPEKTRGFLHFLRTRLVAFLLITLASFIIIAILVGDALISLGSRWLDQMPVEEISNFLHIIMSISTARSVLRFALLTCLIALIYKVLPDALITWRDAWIGAAVTALLLSLGQIAIGYYLRENTTLNAYGAASSFMVLLVWLYYTALAFFYGVEFTYVYAKHFGTPITPQESPLVIRARKTMKRIQQDNGKLLSKVFRKEK